jgi:hypothetical protein
MRSFKQFCEEVLQLDEKLITFGKRPYPKFGQIVILAGGAGSGKGFVLSNLLGIEGNVLDVDALKALAIGSTKLASRIEQEIGVNIKDLNLNDSDNVKKMHEILADVYGITKANQQRVFTGALAAPENRKPNLIFDVTLKDLSKLEKITRNAQNLGYAKENIHVVWVLNDVEMAKQQNLERDRVVPSEILLTTHEGAAITMARIMDMGGTLGRYLDGDMYIVFNKRGEDTTTISSPNGGMYVLDANYLQVKKKGKKIMSRSDLTDEIRNKIRDYTPDTPTWD